MQEGSADMTVPPYLKLDMSPVLARTSTSRKLGVIARIALKAGLLFGPYLV